LTRHLTTLLPLCLLPTHSLQEQYNTIFECTFLPQQQHGGQEGWLLAAYHSGDVRWEHGAPRPACTFGRHATERA
jgi:hypothetical protein